MSTGRSRFISDTAGDTLAMDGGGRPGTAHPIIGHPITGRPMSDRPMSDRPFTIHPEPDRRVLNPPASARLVEDRPTDDPLRYLPTITSMTNDPTGWQTTGRARQRVKA